MSDKVHKVSQGNIPALKRIIPAFCLLLSLQSQGQDSVLVTKNFRFTDGIYLSIGELQANAPFWRWEELSVRYFTNPQTSLTQIESILLRKDSLLIKADDIWGVCIDGIPSIRLPRKEINKDLATFAALKLRGKICYFTYPDWRMKKIQIAAYNPLTGLPFRVGTVEREQEVIVEKIMRFDTGSLADFTVENLLAWIQDDPQLIATFQGLSQEEKQEKLFKCLLIYDDRNQVFLQNKKGGE